MASTLRITDIVTEIASHPSVIPVLGTAPGAYPALSIANDVLQRMLSQSLPWKFNRALITPFLSIALQQDYLSPAVTDLAWLEQGWCIDINNTALPKPVRSLETVRDIQQTWQQSVPFQVSWIPVPLAIYGTWVANTSYPTGLGTASTPTSPIQQFIDANGNFLFVSTNGISGNVQPILPVNSAAGTTVTDGTVVWKVADPNAAALRVTPLPATSGITWEMHLVYQKKPPIKTKLTDTLSPLPDEYGYMFRQGFLAMCMIHAGVKDARQSYAEWEEMLVTALRGADRERDQVTMYPSEGLLSGGQYGWGQPIGPANPFGPYY